MIHELKILPQHFNPVLDELKTAELRKSDRPFSVGDTLLLMEWDGDYTGDACERVITHIANVGEYLPGYVLLSMAPVREHADLPHKSGYTCPNCGHDGWSANCDHCIPY